MKDSNGTTKLKCAKDSGIVRSESVRKIVALCEEVQTRKIVVVQRV